MKKLRLFLLMSISCMSFISCTQEDLSEILISPVNQMAGDGEEGQVDPEEEPPGNKG